MRRPVASLLLFGVASAAWSQPPSTAQQAKSSGLVSISRMGPGTTAPALMPVDFSAAISNQCERKFHGKVEISVDAYGLPQNLKLLRSLEPTLDQKALEAVDRYRFKPALRNKIEPVPVMITIEVNFRLGNYG